MVIIIICINMVTHISNKVFFNSLQTRNNLFLSPEDPWGIFSISLFPGTITFYVTLYYNYFTHGLSSYNRLYLPEVRDHFLGIFVLYPVHRIDTF